MPDVPLRPDPFIPQAAPGALEDLRARLRATRWPDAPEDAGWSLGTDLAYLRELVAYWADGFDWPAQEAALGRLARFRVALGGLGIHFVHVRAAAPAGSVVPLVADRIALGPEVGTLKLTFTCARQAPLASCGITCRGEANCVRRLVDWLVPVLKICATGLAGEVLVKLNEVLSAPTFAVTE